MFEKSSPESGSRDQGFFYARPHAPIFRNNPEEIAIFRDPPKASTTHLADNHLLVLWHVNSILLLTSINFETKNNE
jgi:hypothetical protein